MTPSLEGRLIHQREPEPGLLDPLIGGNGILAPILTPILGGGQTTTSNPPAPPHPTTTTTQQPQQPPPTHTTTTTNNGGGNTSGNSGGSSDPQPPPQPPQSPSDPDTGTGGQTQAAPSSSSGTGDSSDSSPSVGSSVNNGDNPTVSGGTNTGNSGVSSGVGNVGENPTENDPNGTTKGSPTDKGTSTEGLPNPSNIVVISGTTTHLAATPGSSGSNAGSQSQVDSGNPGSGPGGSSTQAAPVSSGSSAQGKSSHVGGAAVGGMVVAILAFFGLFILFFLRKRHIRRRKERQVTWMTEAVTTTPDMSQRNSVRSSWGTPVERRVSNAIPWLSHPPTFGGRQSDPFAANPTASASAPALPMPVLSPTRSRSPENPFTDLPPPPRPLKRMSSLPIRISLISTSSESQSQDPFDDTYEIPGPSTGNNRSKEESRISAATFGHSTTTAPPSQANFPMPPSTAASHQTVFAVSSPSQLLHTPLPPVFPDSPVTPTFGSNGIAASYRRASVKSGFRPSQERCDELQVDQGDRVDVVSVYEDGWAFVHRERNNERGLVPLDCLKLDEPHAL